MSEAPKPWGQAWHPGIPHCNDFACTCRQWDMLMMPLVKSVEAIIGYSPDAPFQAAGNRSGMLIIECPHCFRKFWIHASDGTIAVAKRKCPLWPKT